MQKLLQKFLLACISILIAFLFIEFVLRSIGFSYAGFYMYDKATGSALRPGAEGWWREEGEGFVKINRYGMRDDREISKEKLSGVYRIAVLGDSFAEAFQVDVRDAFWRVLENKLNACVAFDGKKIEVLNFGVAGYATAQELLTLRRRVWDFQPDMVLLAFLSGNDVRDNHASLSPIDPSPFFVLKDGSLSLDTVLLQSFSFRFKSSPLYTRIVDVLDCFRLYQFVKKIQRDFMVKQRASASQKRQPQTNSAPGQIVHNMPAAAPVAAIKQTEPDIGLDNHMYLPPQSKDWDEAWRITEALIAQIDREVKERRAKFFLVTLTNGIQVHPDPKVRKAFAQSLGCDDLLYPDRRIASFAAAHGIEAIILAPILGRYAEQTQQYLHGFPNTSMGTGHWNEKGHRIAGEIIADYLCNQGNNITEQ